MRWRLLKVCHRIQRWHALGVPVLDFNIYKRSVWGRMIGNGMSTFCVSSILAWVAAYVTPSYGDPPLSLGSIVADQDVSQLADRNFGRNGPDGSAAVALEHSEGRAPGQGLEHSSGNGLEDDVAWGTLGRLGTFFLWYAFCS